MEYIAIVQPARGHIRENVAAVKGYSLVHSSKLWNSSRSPNMFPVHIYHNSHHGCYLAVKIVSYILKKALGRKFEKE